MLRFHFFTAKQGTLVHKDDRGPYLGQMYPVELEIKDTTESNTSASYLDLFLSIGRDGQLHILPNMTNATISIFISQIFRSWVAVYQLLPPMASLCRSLYNIPGLAPPMNVLFWGRHDFQISLSKRNTSRNAWNRHWRRFMVNTGIYQTIRSSSLTNAKWHCVAWPNTMATRRRSDFIPISDLFTQLDLLPTYERYPKNICGGFSMLTGDAYSSGHLVPSHLGLAYVQLVETNPFSDLFVTFSRPFIGTFSILLSQLRNTPFSICAIPPLHYKL